MKKKFKTPYDICPDCGEILHDCTCGSSSNYPVNHPKKLKSDEQVGKRKTKKN